MPDVKDTRRALVRLTYDGRVVKTFRGHQAAERFANEVRVLSWLEAAGCDCVPRILAEEPELLRLTTTNCGARVDHLPKDRLRALFQDLLIRFKVRHDDPYLRNVTYDAARGHFCIIDFEYADILSDDAPPGPKLDLPTPDPTRS